ncbi:MAG: ABC transporter permease [Gammaproteobacteria bacterium]|nr:ABC transporter permease [Gammaproteobacteria bacterium]
MTGNATFLFSLAWRDLRASGRYLWVFWSCLMLGVTLIAASGGLFRQVSEGLLEDTRALFGGDLEVEDRAPLPADVLAWMHERGDVSLLIELRTMMLAGGRPQLVELQSVDHRYPLYGQVELRPAMSVAEAVENRGGVWGAAIDPVLARRLDLEPGDRVDIGALAVEVRALIVRQPDRGLSADWRGPPVLIAADALDASRLIQPGSRIEYEYRVRIDGDANAWRDALTAAFPDADFEVHTFSNRSRRMGEVLDQVASGLLLIGFSALFVGGLGVFNSVRAYLDAKLATIAVLRSLGLRDARLAAVYLCQVSMLAGSASLAGAAAGGALAFLGTAAAAERLPLAPEAARLAWPLFAAWLFGMLTALTFALPAVGRALSVSPASLFRGIDVSIMSTPEVWWRLTALCGALLIALVVAALPQPLFGLGFVVVTVLLLVLLEGVVRLIRAGAHRLADHPLLGGHFALKLAVSNLHQRGAPVRVTLLSLGAALTVLVAATLVTAAILKTIADTIPERAPALVFYDISTDQVEELREIVGAAESLRGLELAPLVLGRLSHVNGEPLRESTDSRRALEARDEHKLSHRLSNIDRVAVERGAWWPENYDGPPLVAFEDWESDQIGLNVGDRLRFNIMGETVEATLAAIYGQRRIDTRFWFEGIFSNGVLNRFITRYVGTAYLDHDEAVDIESRLARAMPNVVTVRTERILREARSMLGRAAAGLAVVSGISLLASLLVLVSVVATSRARQIYDATVLHTLGARVAAIRTSLALEYSLIALLVSVFAVTLGSVIAFGILEYRMRLEAPGVWWTGAVAAVVVSAASLGLGARHLLKRLRLVPAELLRTNG